MTEPDIGLPKGSGEVGESDGVADFDSTIISGGSSPAAGWQEKTITKIRVRDFGGFELLGELGQGGMGVVYRARQTSPDREVALKMIHAGRFAAGNFRKRFALEAEAVGNLRHPNIVSLFESGEIDGNLFYTMPLIEGMTLSRSIAEERWGIRESVELVAKLAEAIGHAHQRGVLHRDLKPANIMIDDGREPFVTDFGLAKMIGDSSKDLTMPGAVMGSPAYMAPEQASGRTDEITTATDVYGLGIILYHLVTGNLPFRGATAAKVLQGVLYTEPARPVSKTGRVDRDLSTIIIKCLAKEPARRYATAEALGGDLRRWLAGRPIHARPVGLPTRVYKWVRRRPTLAALITVTVTLSSVAVIGIALGKRNLFRQLIEVKSQGADYEARDGNAGEALARWSEILRLDPDHGLAAERIVEMLRNRNFARREGAVIQTGVTPLVVALTPTNGLSYVGSATNGGRVWLVAGSALKADLHFEGRVGEAVFSRDGAWFLLSHWASGTNSVIAWDTRSGERVFQLPTTKHLGKMAISPDRSRVVTYTRAAGPMLWDVSDPDRPVGRPLSVPEKLTSYDRSQVEIDGAGKYAAVSVGERVVVWDCRDGELVLDAKVGFGLARGLSFDESGTLLAAGSMRTLGPTGPTGHLYFWNLKKGKPVTTEILLYGAPVSCVGISPDGRRLVSGGTTAWQSYGIPKLARNWRSFRIGEMSAMSSLTRVVSDC